MRAGLFTPQARRIMTSAGGFRRLPTVQSDVGGYLSGQQGLTVDQLAERLRRFESFPAHHNGDDVYWVF